MAVVEWRLSGDLPERGIGSARRETSHTGRRIINKQLRLFGHRCPSRDRTKRPRSIRCDSVNLVFAVRPLALVLPAASSCRHGKTRSLALPADQAEPLAAIEEMIATLKELRQRTGDRALLGSYQAAIDRLDALAYRLAEAGAKPPPAPSKPARSIAAPASPQEEPAARSGRGRAQAETAMMQ